MRRAGDVMETFREGRERGGGDVLMFDVWKVNGVFMGVKREEID